MSSSSENEVITLDLLNCPSISKVTCHIMLIKQERVETATKEADTAKAAWLCRVCLTSEVDITIVPCGHVLCHRCCSAVSKCPFCRLQVTKTIRIFRP